MTAKITPSAPLPAPSFHSMPCSNLSTEAPFFVHTSNFLHPPQNIPMAIPHSHTPLVGPCSFMMPAEFPLHLSHSAAPNLRYGAPKTCFVAASNNGEILAALSPRRHMVLTVWPPGCADPSHQRFVPPQVTSYETPYSTHTGK